MFWIELESTLAVETAIEGVPALRADDPQVPEGARLRTVLCVEDNPANLTLVARLLARRPEIRLLGAKDGRRGIEMARAQLPEVILMDINLPGISGITALRMLASDAATAHIPVIAISANAMPRDIEKGLEAGFFRYLTKPIKVHEFMQTLDLALEFAKGESGAAATLEVGP
jgi:CheY-like chemotaxis protein